MKLNFKLDTTRWNRNALLVVGVYFVQGASIIAGLAEFLLTRNAFQFSWIQLSLLAALAMLTWSVKPLYGFLTDLLPLYGLRRKSYLILASTLPFFGYLFLAFFGVGFLPIAFALIIANIGLGFADVIVDGLIVEKADKKTIGWYQAVCWRSKAVGIFFAALFSGLLIERGIFSNYFVSPNISEWLTIFFPAAFPRQLIIDNFNLIDIRFTFIVTAFLPIITLILAFFIKEERVSPEFIKQSRKEIPIRNLLSAVLAFALTAATLIFISSVGTPYLPFMSNEVLASLLILIIWSVWIISYSMHLIKVEMATSTLLYAALFLFLWRFTPSFGAPWTNYFLNTLELSRERIGLLTSLQPLAWVIGSFIYVKFIDKLPIKKVLLWTVCFSAGLSLLQLTIASPKLAETIGSWPIIKNLAAIILTPSYLLVYGSDALFEIMYQSPVINLDAILTFLLQMMFIISFLPLLKLAALVTPKGVEATNFAVLMSVSNLGLAFGAITGGLIYSGIEGQYQILGVPFNSLHLTILIGAATSLLCLLVLPKLDIKGHTRYD